MWALAGPVSRECWAGGVGRRFYSTSSQRGGRVAIIRCVNFSMGQSFYGSVFRDWDLLNFGTSVRSLVISREIVPQLRISTVRETFLSMMRFFDEDRGRYFHDSPGTRRRRCPRVGPSLSLLTSLAPLSPARLSPPRPPLPLSAPIYIFLI